MGTPLFRGFSRTALRKALKLAGQISRAQVVIDTKFQNAFFRELKGQKWVKVPPPAKRLSELEFFP